MDTNNVFEKVANEEPLPPKKQWSTPVFEVMGKEIVKGGSTHSTFEGFTHSGGRSLAYYS
jgi:hypothetical protein